MQPETAEELADRKAALIAPLGPDAVATGNPGCLLQLRSALARTGQSTPVLHTIQIVDASIRNTNHNELSLGRLALRVSPSSDGPRGS